MATDLGRNRSPSTAEYEKRVQGQLTRAEKRIRTLDLTAALLTFAAATLAYAVVAILLDRWLLLPTGVRQAGFVVYLLAAAAYLTAFVLRPLARRINPYFAARQLERTLPDAKNSVVNWLDLREANLPPAIRGAVGQRAAKAVAGADPEKAVSGRWAWIAGAVAVLCAAAFIAALFFLGFRPFMGLLGRTFAPFGAADTNVLPTSTQIRVVKPVDGNAVVPGDRPMDILVRVDGRVPDPRAEDALKLLFRYQPAAAYQQRPLEKADDGGRWGVSLPAVDVQDGFWYKVTGGDAETPEYRVRLTPRVLDFKTVYTFRPYTAKAKETRTERKIEALRGTQVDVTVHTNRDVKDGWLQFEGANGTTITHGEALPGDPQAFTVQLTLDESSQYRICFTSAEGETFTEPQSFPLTAVPDKPPVVTLTQPAEEKPGWIHAVQADGLLPLEGKITDDVGVAEARLNLKVGKDDKDDLAPLQESRSLPAQEYRSRDAFKLPHGGNPTTVDYKDFVDLAKLKLDPGLVLEYWLTAEDACDYPDPNKPNVGESKHYRVRIAPPTNNPQAAAQQRKDAEQGNQANQQKQDQQFKNEDQKRQDDNKQSEQGGQSGSDKNGNPKNDGDKGGEHGNDTNSQSKPGDDDKTGMGEQHPGDNNPQNGNNPGDPNKPNPGGGDKGNKSNPDQGNNAADQKAAQDRLNDAVNKIRQDQEGSGKTDPQDHPAEAKDGGQQPKPQQPADAKDGGGKEGAKDASQPKDGPQNKPGERHDEGTGKDQGNPDAKQQPQGEAKPGGDPKAGPDAKPGASKDGKTEAAPQPGASKDGGKPDDQKQAGGDKPQPGAAGDNTPKAENKEGNPPNPTGGAQPAGQAKDKAPPETKAEPKPGPDASDKNAPKSQGKGDGAKNPMDGPKQASAKGGGDMGDPKDAAQPKADGGSGDKPPPDDKADPKDTAELLKKLQDDLKSNDPDRKQAAEEFIRRYMTQSPDSPTRDAANKALQDAGLEPGDGPAAANKPKDPPDAPPDAPKPPPPGEGKPGPDKDTPQTKDNPPDNPQQGEKKGESKGDGKPPKDDDPMKPKQPETPPATGKSRLGPGEPGPHDGSRSNDPENPPKPEAPLAQPKNLLQLYNFWQRVPKDVLKDVQADPEQRKILEQAATNGKEELPGTQHGGPLNSTVGKTSNPNGQGPTDDPNNGSRAQPPPEYRGPYKDFTKLLSPGGK